MTGAEIVALFDAERDAAAKKVIDDTKAAGKFKVPRPNQIRFRLGGKKPRRPTATRIYDAEQKLLEAMTAFPDFEPERIIRAVSRYLLLEPIIIARLWTTVRARFDSKRARETVR